MFRNAEVGDKVWSPFYDGWGVISAIDEGNIYVSFKESEIEQEVE